MVETGYRRCVVSCTRLKLLHWERGGFVIYHKRFERGILTMPRLSARKGGCRVTWRELVLMELECIQPRVCRRSSTILREWWKRCGMLFGRKSERFIPSDPSQFKLDFEGVAEMKEEREYAALQASVPTARKKPAPRIKRPTEERQLHIFADHPERRYEIIEPAEIPSESKRIGEAITELLEYKPGELYIRRKYALPGGEGVVIGDLTSLPLPKSKVYVPANADANLTSQNRELLTFPNGVANRTEAIQHRIDTAGLHRKLAKNPTKAIRIILTGTDDEDCQRRKVG